MRSFEKKMKLFLLVLCMSGLCGCGSEAGDQTPVGGWVAGEDTPSSSQPQDTAPSSADEPENSEQTGEKEGIESEGNVILCFELINYEKLRLALEPLDMSGTENPLEAGADAPVYTHDSNVGEKLEAYGETYENRDQKGVFYYEIGSNVSSYTITLYNSDGTIDGTYDKPVAPYQDAFIVIDTELEDGTKKTYGFWYCYATHYEVD